jgi:hypothetical protein
MRSWMGIASLAARNDSDIQAGPTLHPIALPAARAQVHAGFTLMYTNRTWR